MEAEKTEAVEREEAERSTDAQLEDAQHWDEAGFQSGQCVMPETSCNKMLWKVTGWGDCVKTCISNHFTATYLYSIISYVPTIDHETSLQMDYP